MGVGVKDGLESAMEISRAAVTAALPSIMFDINVKRIAHKYGDVDSVENLVMFDLLADSVRDVLHRQLTEALVVLGVDLKSREGLAILAGATMTAIFIVYAATVSHESPLKVWKSYLSGENDFS